jgi:hypothetical protein
VQTGGNATSTADGMDITAPTPLPGPVTANDSIVVTASFSVPTVPSISDTLGNEFVLAAGPSGAASGNLTTIWYAKNVAGGSDTVNVTYDCAPDQSYLEVIAVEYRGLTPSTRRRAVSGRTSRTSSRRRPAPTT